MDKQPSKESLERAEKFYKAWQKLEAGPMTNERGEYCSQLERRLRFFALEFDAIRRERNEAVEKLAEAL